MNKSTSISGEHKSETISSQGFSKIVEKTGVVGEQLLDTFEIVEKKTIEDLLLDETCTTIDFMIDNFNTTFKYTHTRKSILNSAEVSMHLSYFGYMSFMMGDLRIKGHNGKEWLKVGKYLFETFREAKNTYINELDTNKENNFIDRMMPLVRRRLPDITIEEEKKLQDMYAFIQERHMDIDPETGKKKPQMRSQTTYDGRKITYVTHLKETFLMLLFFGKEEDLSVSKLLAALGHDLEEDTKHMGTTIHEIKEKFGPKTAFMIKHLTKKSPEEVIDEDLADEGEIFTEDDRTCLNLYKIWKSNQKREGLSSDIDNYDNIDKDIEKGKNIMDKAKHVGRNSYFDNIDSLFKAGEKYNDINGYVYIHPETLEILEEPLGDIGTDTPKVKIEDIIDIKACDMIANLSTMHSNNEEEEIGSGKIWRKVNEAKLLKKKLDKYFNKSGYHSKYISGMVFWINNWQEYLTEKIGIEKR